MTPAAHLFLEAQRHYVSPVESTNDRLREMAQQGAPAGTVVWSNSQQRGRGRYTRSWHSPPGGLYASFLFRPEASLTASLPVFMAVAAHAYLTQDCGLTALGLRWPNDIMHHGSQKIAGILCEAQWCDSQSLVIAGIGLNVAAQQWPSDLQETATSLEELGVAGDAARHCAGLCRMLAHRYPQWSALSPTARINELSTACQTLGKRVRLELVEGQLEGTAMGLDPEGQLVLKTANGHVRHISAARLIRLYELT